MKSSTFNIDSEELPPPSLKKGLQEKKITEYQKMMAKFGISKVHCEMILNLLQITSMARFNKDQEWAQPKELEKILKAHSKDIGGRKITADSFHHWASAHSFLKRQILQLF